MHYNFVGWWWNRTVIWLEHNVYEYAYLYPLYRTMYVCVRCYKSFGFVEQKKIYIVWKVLLVFAKKNIMLTENKR